MDSSAILASLQNEKGALLIGPLLAGTLLSTVNLAEVHTKLLNQGLAPAYAWKQISGMNCEVCHFTEEQAKTAAELVPTTRPYGLSLGDRACLALAIERKAKVLTADRIWQNLSLGIEIEVIR